MSSTNQNNEIRFLSKKAKAGWCSYYRILDEARKTVELLEKMKGDIPLQYLTEIEKQIHGLRRYDREYQKKKEEEEEKKREEMEKKREETEEEEDDVEGSIALSTIPEEKKEEPNITEATPISEAPTTTEEPTKKKKEYSRKKCACGAKVIKMSRHLKTKAHKDFMEQVVLATVFEPNNVVLATIVE